MAANYDTTQIQDWVQAVIVADDRNGDVLELAGTATGLPADAIEDITLPSESLTELERLDIYRDMYVIRMRDALVDDYPSTLDWLGWDAFESLVRDYITVFPSRSFTLNHLGDHFPEYLRTAKHIERNEILAELAELELAITQIFHADESPTLTTEAVAAIPADAWDAAKLTPVAALALLALRHNVTKYHEAAYADIPRPKIARKRTYVAVYRKDYSVYHLELSVPEHELLRAVLDGATLGDAVAYATKGLKPREAEKLVFKSFSDWVARGFFTSVEYTSQPG